MTSLSSDFGTTLDSRFARRASGQTDTSGDAADTAFDRLVRLTQRLLDVPSAVVSLLHDDRFVFRSAVGLPQSLLERGLALEESLCRHTIALQRPLAIADARQVEELRDTRAVRELGVVAYVAIPLITDEGEIVGTLAALDGRPRIWSERDVDALADIAASVLTELELRAEIRERRRIQASLDGPRRVLERIALAAPLGEVLEALVEHLERQCPGAISSVMLADESGTSLHLGAAPLLPAEIIRVLDAGLPIAPGAGSCGTAAFRRAPVITEDIREDPAWTAYRPVAEAHGLRACWSYPILDADATLLGTFALYYRAVYRPSLEDERIIADALHLARIAISRERAGRALRVQQERLAAIIETQQDVGLADLDLDTIERRIAARLRHLTGADGAAIGRVEGSEVVYRVFDGIHTDGEVVRLPIDGSLSGLSVRTGQLVRCDDAASDARSHHVIDQRYGIGSSLVMPLVFDGRTIGIASVVASRAHAFRDEDEATLRSVAGLLAAAMSHAGEFEAKRSLVAERTAALAALQTSEKRFRSLIENASDPVIILDGAAVFRYASPAVERTTGSAPEALVGTHSFARVHPDDVARVAEAFGRLLADPTETPTVEFLYRHEDGSWRNLVAVGRNLLDEPAVNGVVVNLRDTTEQNALAEQLRQAQKMEAVGRLAGGIAHDFNNILTVITCNCEMLLDELAPQDPRREDIEEIHHAADRAVALTTQLLAFSRKQFLKPKALDLNRVVVAMEPMLRRLIGEDIELATIAGATAAGVHADPGQLEQVLVNLVVNARDAMPAGGAVMIETANVAVDVAAGRAQGIEPGAYVALAVTDTGHGMDEATRVKIFEPFFTTKEPGKGTGLGLSTVYGIVQQSGGSVQVRSAPGHGSTFEILLPAVRGGAVDEPGPAPAPIARGSETILLVEDEEAVRGLARRILRQQGYTVLEARHGRDALQVAEAHRGDVDLLLTDVVMPEMNGRALVEELLPRHPTLRVVFMSGYTDDDIVRRGELGPHSAFLPKPFSASALARAVRDALDAGR